MSIHFQFDPEKTVEAAAMLLKLNGQPMRYLGLLKMLYIADRCALQMMDQPITGDQYVSMKYGPVLSGVYDLIKGNNFENSLSYWSKFIDHQPKSYDVVLLEDPGTENLCKKEEDILIEVYKKFGNIDPFAIAEWTHSLPEWKNPLESSTGSKAIPITIDEILSYLEKTYEEISEIEKNAGREAYLNQNSRHINIVENDQYFDLHW